MNSTDRAQRKSIMWTRVIEEGLRMFAILSVIIGYVWAFGEASIDKYIGKIIDERHYATVNELDKLTVSVDKLQEQQTDTGKLIAGLSSKTDAVITNTQNIQNLLNQFLLAKTINGVSK